jgi:geranylgeranyl reductase family protein
LQDILIIGAGPAGSAAAIALAQSGFTVTLVDRAEFPRDKVCGDALIPDAIRALDRLGVRSAALAGARCLRRLRVYAPDGTTVTLGAPLAAVPRHALDEALRRAACDAGARFIARRRLEGPLVHEGRVAGGAFVDLDSGGTVTIAARWTLLATGAAAQPLTAFDVCERRDASAMAVRAYFKVRPEAARTFEDLVIAFDRAISPGYGWIFPGPAGVFNVGAGFFYDGRRRATANARALWETFVGGFGPARDVLRGAVQLGPLKGAPLRTALTGSRLARPGLLVVGEAAGLTYSLTGEGIGKAMESSLLAADVLAAPGAFDSPRAAAAAPEYSRRLIDAFGSRFRGYRAAQRWLEYPAVANFLAHRAARGGYVHRQLEALLNETSDPRELFSVGGLLRAVFS